MTPRRIRRSAIAVAESTLLDFHRALVSMKLQRLFSQKSKSRPGPKGPSRDLIKLVVEMKERNLDYACPKIAALITNVTGREIDAESVRRILKKHFRPMPGRGPSWLMPIGSHTNKLWSVDLFRMDSAFLKTYWVMVVMDQFSREYLSSDNDPLFGYWRWRVHLAEHYQIKEIKTVRGAPWIHPFVERLIGICRREFTDRIIFWNEAEITDQRRLASIDMKNFRWKSVCGGMYQTPIPA